MEPGTHATLDRRLGPLTAASVVVANVIGAGIFTTSGFLARDLGDPVALLAVWVVGGMLALAGALSYSELGAAMPEAGGEYVYLRETYGPLVGFLSGWVSFFIGFSGAIAAVSLAFAHYAAHFFPAVEPPRVAGIALAIALVWGLTMVHALGVGLGGLFQRMITAATVSAILVLVVAGFWLGTGDTAHFRSAEPAMWSNFPVSLVFVMFAYSGWNAAAYLAGEIREPARNLPLALLGGTVMVTALYLALNTFYLYALPIPEMAGVQAIAEKASVAAFGQVASHLVTGMLLLALAGSVSAMVLAGPRVYFAMARDGVFPQAIATVHPRFHTPARAIFLQSTWCTILICVSAFESLVVYVSFILVLFAGLAVLGVFVLRARRPDLPRPFRVPAYPFLPALFVAASPVIAVFTFRVYPKESLWGLLTVAAGVPFYLLFRRSRRRG